MHQKITMLLGGHSGHMFYFYSKILNGKIANLLIYLSLLNTFSYLQMCMYLTITLANGRVMKLCCVMFFFKLLHNLHFSSFIFLWSMMCSFRNKKMYGWCEPYAWQETFTPYGKHNRTDCTFTGWWLKITVSHWEHSFA